jgi:formate/nitrite transporter FocA (FNT family)
VPAGRYIVAYGSQGCCLAVWLATGGRSLTDKVVAIVPPIAAFVANGFEHSVANMYFIPMGLALKGIPAWRPRRIRRA